MFKEIANYKMNSHSRRTQRTMTTSKTHILVHIEYDENAIFLLWIRQKLE